ncbi:MAG TPA: glycoside hydrolase family 5 protein [Candidatus Omnitrophota bacterium]|nr:glycoside hydrolase family 5 protein [Candidatus Omnitrophota bacterium]HSA30277.1 glycoside hydrolase family 5 protein [Candidatus Omnitrophota bacterium]
MSGHLSVVNGVIRNEKGPVRLKGVNLGGWLMMEGYIMGARNIAVRNFKKDFALRLGKKALEDLERSFCQRFIQRSDFERIKALGFNCIRLPFHYGLIEAAPFKMDPDGVAHIDRALRWAKDCGLKVLLDMHAAPGSQNHDWHSDSLGKAGFWNSAQGQKRACAIWGFLADRYKDHVAVAGYDLLNEAVIHDPRMMNSFYKQAIRAIRAAGSRQIVFVEGNRWATDLQSLDDFDDENLVWSIHFYHPIEFVFNSVPELKYPLRSKKGVFDRNTLQRMVGRYARFARKKKRAVYVGEFGVNSRAGLWGEDLWLVDVLDCFAQEGFHWTYWTFKAVKSHMFPDGIYSYMPNDLWVNRPGPKAGWETYADLWRDHRAKIIQSWSTENFRINQGIADILKKAAKA